MVQLKKKAEIALMQAGAAILSQVHGSVAQAIAPGVSTQYLDQLATAFIQQRGAKPSFKGYQGFPHALCISVNDCIIHGAPSAYVLQSGDIVSVDCGVCYKGFHTDAAFTYGVGVIPPKALDLLRITKEALYIGIACALAGNRTGDIGAAIQQHVEQHGYAVVREFSGHGVGKALHEDPEVPNYGKRGSGPKIQEGMALAIEPMVNQGKKYIRYGAGKPPAVYTADGTLSAHFEHTVVVLDGQPRVLTSYAPIEAALRKKAWTNKNP